MDRPRYQGRSVAVFVVVIGVCAVVAVGPAGGLSPPPCNEATGIARLGDGNWILTSWDRVQTFETDWDHGAHSRTTVPNRTYGVARGPEGSLWLLQSERVRRVSTDLSVERTLTLPNSLTTNGTAPESADLAFAGRWLVLADGEVASYDANWSDYDPTPPVQTVVPENTRGMVTTGEQIVFVTGNGTLVGAERRASDRFIRTDTVSLNVSGEAVDIHPGPDETVLLLQPGKVTAYDGDLNRIGQQADVFSPEGCDWDGSGFGWWFLLGILATFSMYGLGVLLVVGVVVGMVLVLRR